MPKQTRTNTKRSPAFDPSELADLIHTPAVGSGVSSHLLSRPDRESEPGEPDMTTVAAYDMTTAATEPDYFRPPYPATEAVTDQTTVVASQQSPIPIWVSESGNYVPAGKVRPHIAAEDALSAAEKAIYGLLESIAVPGSGAARTAQAGYQAIMRRTGLSKKTVQRTIDKLVEKDFLAIAIPSDSNYRTPTTYSVFDSGAVMVRHKAGGRLHVARFGPGVGFVRLLTA